MTEGYLAAGAVALQLSLERFSLLAQVSQCDYPPAEQNSKPPTQQLDDYSVGTDSCKPPPTTA